MTEAEPSLMIVGCGDLGLRVGAALHELGWRIGALRRHPPEQADGFHWFAADYTQPGSLDLLRDWRPDFVLFCPTPLDRDLAGYRAGFADAADNLLGGLGDHRPCRIVMVSSTRVYAERDGGWVDEQAPLSTSDQRAMAIIDAERHLRNAGTPATIVRSGGIYGSAPGRLVAKVARGEISPLVPVRYTNRIHREDCAGFLQHLLLLAEQDALLEPVYNAVDDLPAPAHDVESWLADQLGVEARPIADHGEAPQSHKRCRNALLHASGYHLRYPDYRSGYTQILQAQMASSP